MKEEIKEWQWHQLDHMQIICTSLRTDNHANTVPHHLIFYRLDALPDALTLSFVSYYLISLLSTFSWH